MKIGIGVTTYNRPQHIALWKEQIYKHAPDNVHEIYIASDSDTRLGIAYRKNECLKALKGCDYIFLFDDDCLPVKNGWANYFIQAHKISGQHHFLYLRETETIRKIREELVGENLTLNIYDNCGGCFMFLTREVIEQTGGYNRNYGYYGFEHAGFSNRIHKAGLTPLGMYQCPSKAGEYIYAMDYDFHLPLNKQVSHHSSLAGEINNINSYIEQNRKIYLEDIQTIKQPL
jgi:hypothetical protein